METKVLKFFGSILIWDDILSYSTQRKSTTALEIYPRLLKDQEFSLAFQEVTGCESWVVAAIKDTTDLEVWKSDQRARGTLSIRELVNRAGKIESVIEEEILRLAKILQPIACPRMFEDEDNADPIQDQTYLFAHSLLIELHRIVSGPCPDVPEINESINRAISAWKLISYTENPNKLFWPYCVSANLATGPQRDFFLEAIAKMISVDTTLGNTLDLKSLVEKCWSEFDKQGLSSDWRDIIQRSNLGWNVFLFA